MLVGTDLKKIKYIAVEVIKKDVKTPSTVECGLFMGVCHKKSYDNKQQLFLVLLVSKSSIRLYNLNKYNIITIDATDKMSRYMTVFVNNENDQKAAVKLLDEFTKTLLTDQMIYANDPNNELINVEQYSHYPINILNADNLTGDVTEDTIDDTTNNVVKDTTAITQVSAKKPSITLIKRKGKLPCSKNMESMRQKVLQIAYGNFKQLKVKSITHDKKVKDNTTVKKSI